MKGREVRNSATSGECPRCSAQCQAVANSMSPDLREGLRDGVCAACHDDHARFFVFIYNYDASCVQGFATEAAAVSYAQDYCYNEQQIFPESVTIIEGKIRELGEVKVVHTWGLVDDA